MSLCRPPTRRAFAPLAAAALAVLLVAVPGRAEGSADGRADELTELLKKGPMARVDTDKNGRFDAVLSVVDVDAPAEDLWRALTAFDSYRCFMPRISSVGVRRGDDGGILVDWAIDTPLVATKYTNTVTVNDGTMTMTARTIVGDMVGSHYEWRVVKLSSSTCRMFHGAWPRSYAAIVSTLDDDQQTLTIGVSVGSVFSTTRALKARAEQLARNRPMQPTATIRAP